MVLLESAKRSIRVAALAACLVAGLAASCTGSHAATKAAPDPREQALLLIAKRIERAPSATFSGQVLITLPQSVLNHPAEFKELPGPKRWRVSGARNNDGTYSMQLKMYDATNPNLLIDKVWFSQIHRGGSLELFFEHDGKWVRSMERLQPSRTTGLTAGDAVDPDVVLSLLVRALTVGRATAISPTSARVSFDLRKVAQLATNAKLRAYETRSVALSKLQTGTMTATTSAGTIHFARRANVQYPVGTVVVTSSFTFASHSTRAAIRQPS